MEKAKVYFTKEITPESVVKMYETLGVNLPGKVAVKLHSGEKGNQNYIKPEFVKAIVEKVKEYVLSKNYSIITLDGVRVSFDDGWALVRASNTGPNLTVRFEAISEERLMELQNEFINVIETFRK